MKKTNAIDDWEKPIADARDRDLDRLAVIRDRGRVLLDDVDLHREQVDHALRHLRDERLARRHPRRTERAVVPRKNHEGHEAVVSLSVGKLQFALKKINLFVKDIEIILFFLVIIL